VKLRFGLCFLLLVLCAGNPAVGQQAPAGENAAAIDLHPLRPPDTSSPRDTLRSFQTSIADAIDAWRRGPLDARGIRNVVSAASTLDYSATAEREFFTGRVEKILLLKELLDRIPLPPVGQIPGDAEVAARGITRWTIPDTRITIAKVTDGPRAGEFLFSADTVQQLELYYRLAKDLPYKRGATATGMYETFMEQGGGETVDARVRVRLKRAEALSPRQTLVGFLDSLNRVDELLQDANAKLRAQLPEMTPEKVAATEATARNLLRRAHDLLDLSQLPEAYRETAAVEAALQLKEVIDRTQLPFLESVPDVRAVEHARRREAAGRGDAGEGYRWRYPNTEIEIVEVLKGPRRGQFLFSAETVRRAGEFYRKVRDLPYRTEIGTTDRSRFDWTGESKGIFKRYISSPGYLIPEAHLLGRLVDRLPAPFKTLYGEQTLWQWIGLLLCIVATAVGWVAVYRATRHVADRVGALPRGWLMILAPLLVALLVQGVLDFLGTDVNVTGRAMAAMVLLAKVSIALLAVSAVSRLVRAIGETLIVTPKPGAQGVDASLVRISTRIIAFVAGALIIIYTLRNLGADLVPLVAGLGVGGLAVALGAQRTFANFIGSLILFANKPVKVGDFCRYGDQVGTVESIGLLATRIRSLERTIVTVPNAEFSEMKIDNFTLRDQRLLKTVLQLRYETTSEQLRYILARLRELLAAHPKVLPAPARVRFVGYGAYSKDLEVFAYLDCTDHDVFLAIQEDILLRMEDIVNEAGSGFAFPSQTAYLTRDKGVDAKRGSAAEAEVERWRARGRLPFPEFDEEDHRRMDNVLDYPPKGSPGYVAPKVVARPEAATPVPTLSSDELHDLPSLIAKLRQKDRMTEYLSGRLSPPTRALIAGYGGGRDQELKDALVSELNEIIIGPSIYDEQRFAGVELRAETREAIATEPQGEDLAWLNRRLLEDAFPRALGGRRESD
jgi:MscS family membrane protein